VTVALPFKVEETNCDTPTRNEPKFGIPTF
jgi:hypothetical protein